MKGKRTSNQKKILSHLKRVVGQLQGVINAVESGQELEEGTKLFIQFKAALRSLESLENKIIKESMKKELKEKILDVL